jgi:AcrR family transcriptional regulator
MKTILKKQDWLEHGLQTLSSHGFEALKAEPMAKSMKVSRGSFYWHFADIKTFHQEVLEHWQEVVTRQVIADVATLPENVSKVRSLVQLAFNGNADLERAVRSWATQNENASAIAKAVDKQRIDFMVGLLISEGVSLAFANSRAAFLYWGYLGQTMTTNPRHETASKSDLDNIIDLFLLTDAK